MLLAADAHVRAAAAVGVSPARGLPGVGSMPACEGTSASSPRSVVGGSANSARFRTISTLSRPADEGSTGGRGERKE